MHNATMREETEEFYGFLKNDNLSNPLRYYDKLMGILMHGCVGELVGLR